MGWRNFLPPGGLLQGALHTAPSPAQAGPASPSGAPDPASAPTITRFPSAPRSIPCMVRIWLQAGGMAETNSAQFYLHSLRPPVPSTNWSRHKLKWVYAKGQTWESSGLRQQRAETWEGPRISFPVLNFCPLPYRKGMLQVDFLHPKVPTRGTCTKPGLAGAQGEHWGSRGVS